MRKSKKSKQHQTLHFVAATIFSIVTFVHILRLSMGWPIVIGNWVSPPLFSWIGVLLAGSLAVLMWRTACE